jgi:hypothetical protein
VRAALRRLREKKSWDDINTMTTEALTELLQTSEGGPRQGWRALSPDALAPYVASRRDALARNSEDPVAGERDLEASDHEEKPPISAEDPTFQLGSRVSSSDPKPKVRRVTSRKGQLANTEGGGSKTAEHSIMARNEIGRPGYSREGYRNVHPKSMPKLDSSSFGSYAGLDNSIDTVRALLRTLRKQLEIATRLRGAPKTKRDFPRLQRQFRVARSRFAHLERQTTNMTAQQLAEWHNQSREATNSPTNERFKGGQPSSSIAKLGSSYSESPDHSDTPSISDGVSLGEKLKNSRRRSVGLKGGRIDRISASQLQVECARLVDSL